MDIYEILTVTAAFAVAGFIKGVIGLGLPPIAIGIMALIMPPAQAAAFLLAPSLLTNIWQLVSEPGVLSTVRRFSSLCAGLCFGSWLGADLLTSLDSKLPNIALGSALAIYSVLGLCSVKFHVNRTSEKYWSPLIGTLSGIAMAATGVMMVPAIPYLYALNLTKDEILQALGLVFIVAAVALAGILFEAGILGTTNATGSALALVPAVLGMHVGQRLLTRINTQVFRVYFLIGLLLLGAFIALKATFH